MKLNRLIVALFLITVLSVVVSCNLGPRQYIGNVNTKVFHLENCSHLPMAQNRIIFENRDAAINSGYTACGICKP